MKRRIEGFDSLSTKYSKARPNITVEAIKTVYPTTSIEDTSIITYNITAAPNELVR